MFEHLKSAFDVAAPIAAVSVIMGLLPYATIILSFIWACFRIYELKTVQDWLAKRRKKNEDTAP